MKHISHNDAVFTTGNSNGGNASFIEQTVGSDQVTGSGNNKVSGAGIGIAILDTGIAQTNDFENRIVANVDFTGEGTYDLNGHGTHVSGIAAGNGSYRGTSYAGIAPGANLISVKVLGADGTGDASTIIQGIEWTIRNRNKYNIRVINLSLGMPVTESYKDDPLCQAVETAVKAGIVVVAAAGNLGKTLDGTPLFGAIHSPGNDPLVITVGAVKHNDTVSRSDDSVDTYSSKGRTAFDHHAKPDVVAPGNKIVSVAAPGSKLLTEHPENAVAGGRYLTWSGTSMAFRWLPEQQH